MYAKPMPLVSPVKGFWPADILDLVKKSKYTQNLKYEHFFQGVLFPDDVPFHWHITVSLSKSRDYSRGGLWKTVSSRVFSTEMTAIVAAQTTESRHQRLANQLGASPKNEKSSKNGYFILFPFDNGVYSY